ncbi:MAG: tripartite tricarboxylate transporter permease, partial [Burkholderiales bacterium]
LVLWGFKPGPLFIPENPALFWGLVASMYIGNVMLLVLNLPLAPVFAALLRVRYAYLAPGILAISLVGAYASTLGFTTVWIALAFGVVGWFMIKLDFPRAPLVLALVLAPLLESSLRQSLLLSFGSLRIFVERPLSAALLACVALSLAYPLFAARRKVG